LAADLGATIGRLAADIPGSQNQDLMRLTSVRMTRAAEAAAFFKSSAAKWAHIRALHAPERDVEEAIVQHLTNRPIENFLDAGTGTGRMIELLAPFAKRAVGLDISPDMLAIARDRLMHPEFAHCQVRLGDVYRLSLANGSPTEGFDTILFHQVLHYLEDPRSAILAAARVLRPAGRILIADFAPHNLEFLRSEYAHRRLGFPDDEVEGWFSTANLSLSACQTIEPEAASAAQLTVRIWLASTN
jgi:SAM-dependent methyltransferase